ncbi:MAG: Na+/H+ antiporter [Gammaproteobacteria bacterium]
MQTITVALAMLLAIVVSGYLVRLAPLPLPLPLVQIALGAAIASVASLGVTLQPDIFFLLFLPPLLFLDGWRIPKEALFRDRAAILALALGLVVFTVVGVGYFVHWMIPAMPLPVAFALAAVLAPTDPIGVSAIAERVPIPKRMMLILQGESLLNDASGLVCLRFAVAAALTGAFSLPEAFLTFLRLAIGGLAIGAALTWGVAWLKGVLSRRVGEESGTQILISVLIPFGAYMLAEHLGCSGILAAVAAGITMSYAESSGQALAITRVRRSIVWDAVHFVANGVIFVLLGEQLPAILSRVHQSGHGEPWWLLLYVVAITVCLAALRFAWVWTSLQFTLFRPRRIRADGARRPGLRPVAAMSVAGVKGAITLAGILTLPLVMSDGSPFPARDLAIALAGGVIILSLLLAAVALPRLLSGLEMPDESWHRMQENRARVAAAEAAIRAIEQEHHRMARGRDDADLYTQAATRIMDRYRERIDGSSRTGEAADGVRRLETIERSLRIAGRRAEREEVFRLAREHELEQDAMRKLVREVDLLDARESG